MDSSVFTSLNERLEQAQRNIRQHLFRVGLVGQWHVDKAVKILEDQSLLAKYVVLPGDTEDDTYFAVLPDLVRDVVQQDTLFAEIWATNEKTAHFTEQQRRLMEGSSSIPIPMRVL